MHPRIHVCIIIYVQKEIITCHASSNNPSYFTKSLKIISKKNNKEIWKKSQQWQFFCVSLTNVKYSRSVCRHFKSKIQVLLLYIKTLCEAMVINSLMFTSRPSAKQWSLISSCSHQDSLWSNGHWFPCVYIKALYEAMVIDFLCHIEVLYEAMVINLFTSRPSAKQWSLISYVTSRPSVRQWSSISLHQDPLQSSGHWFLMSHWGPLRGNDHRSLYIKTLCEVMVIDLFPFDIDPLLGNGLICFFKKSEKKIIKQNDLSNHDPLLGNGHWIFWI